MRKTFFRVFGLIFTFVSTTCNSSNKIDGYNPQEILVVTLDLKVSTIIEKIILHSSYNGVSDSILKIEIVDQKTSN